jgi:ABC-2 type transport system ATP-binding protein
VNGAGKSTLFRLCLDLISLDSGQIQINDLPHKQTEARQYLAYLPERFSAPHYLTGGEILRGLLALHKIDYDDNAARSECRSLDLDPATLTQRARHFSKGMLQKLGLIACTMSQCELLLLDEPLSGLDPLAQHHFRDRLLSLKALGTTLFFSTHALHDAAELCDRIVLLHQGQIAFDGSPDNLRELAPNGSLNDAFLFLATR